MSKTRNPGIIRSAIRRLGRSLAASGMTSAELYDAFVTATESASGKTVTPETAMQIATVSTCVRIISQTIGSLPLHVYKRLDVGGRQRWPDHPLASVLARRPNPWQTSMEWIEQMVAHLLLRGNYYAAILRHGDSIVDDLIPLDPDRMEVAQNPDYSLKYTYTRPSGGPIVLAQSEVLHIRGLTTDGILGRSVVSDARELFGSSLAAAEYGARLLRNDATPGLVLESPNKLSDAAYKRLREDWSNRHSGSSNAGKTAILEEGLKASKVSLTADEAQFLETIQAQRSQIAGWFGVPLMLLSFNENTQTYASAEQFFLSFITLTIRPWLVRIEKSLHTALFTAPDYYYPEFSSEGFLRGDIKTRYQSYATGISWGFLSPNEAREMENRNAREGGDVFLQPLNMGVSGQDREEIMQ